jgi:hypothetical protein
MEGHLMNNISDIRTRIESGEKSSLVTRIAELEETPVLTLVDTAERSGRPSEKLFVLTRPVVRGDAEL